MLEIELKAVLGNCPVEELAEKLLARGFLFLETVDERDDYFNAPDRNFARTDEALRIREERRAEGTKAYITYKGAKQGALSSTRLEHETELGSADSMRRILTALSYNKILTVQKSRQLYQGQGQYTGYSICLDRLAELGSFIEIEYLAATDTGPNEEASLLDSLLALLDDLGISRQNLTRKSYLELLIERTRS